MAAIMINGSNADDRSDELRLSIIVSTVRPAECNRLLDSLLPYASDEEIILVLDGTERDKSLALRERIATRSNIRLVEFAANQGLSACRNRGLSLATKPWIVFLDDDVRLVSDIVSGYRRRFREGYRVVGGPLRLPRSYPALPWWLPTGLSSLLGIHTREIKIWGGNFGFARIGQDARRAKFRGELGRKGGGLQSGEDTTFIRELLEPGNRYCFAPELAVEHHIGLERYTPVYLIRRAFWQGRSEVRRRSFISAVSKEAIRAVSLGSSGFVGTVRMFVGLSLFTCFLCGMWYEVGRQTWGGLRLIRWDVPLH